MALTFKRLILVVVYFLWRVSIGVALPIEHSLVTRDVETSIHPGIYSGLGPELHPREPTDSKEGGVGEGSTRGQDKKRKRDETEEERPEPPKRKNKYKYSNVLEEDDSDDTVKKKNAVHDRHTKAQEKKRLAKRKEVEEQQEKDDKERRKTMGPKALARDDIEMEEREAKKEKKRKRAAHARAGKKGRVVELPAGRTQANKKTKEEYNKIEIEKKLNARKRKTEKQRNKRFEEREAAKKKKEEEDEARRSEMAPEQSLHSSHPVSHHDEPNPPAAHTPTQAPTGVAEVNHPTALHPSDSSHPYSAASHDDRSHSHPTEQSHTSTHARTTEVTAIDPSHLSSMPHGGAAEHLQPPAGGPDDSSTQHQSEPPLDKDALELANARHLLLSHYPFHSGSHSNGSTTYVPASKRPPSPYSPPLSPLDDIFYPPEGSLGHGK